MKASVNDVKVWFEARGFERGLKDKDLQKPIIALACVVVGSYIWMTLSASQVKSASEQIVEEQNRVKMIQDYAAVSQLWSSLGSDMMAPRGEDAKVWIQKEMAILANEVKVEVVTLEPVGSETLGALVREESRLTIQGSFHNIGRFVSKIENHKPFIGISTFQFTRGDNFDPDHGRILPATLTIFVFRETVRGKQ